MADDLDVATALRTVADRMGSLPWTTGIENAFRMLADELETQRLGLDPEPYLFLAGDTRLTVSDTVFYDRDILRFAPREGYNQDEDDYVRHLEARYE